MVYFFYILLVALILNVWGNLLRFFKKNGKSTFCEVAYYYLLEARYRFMFYLFAFSIPFWLTINTKYA